MSESDTDAASGRGHGPGIELARLVYGGVLLYTALGHFRDTESMAQYAKSKGVPAPKLAVQVTGTMLAFGGLGIALWRLPRLAASAAVTFFLVVTPEMHDFWNQEGQERSNQQNHFLKNLGLLSAALAFFAYASHDRR